jgi:hypothetical protein
VTRVSGTIEEGRWLALYSRERTITGVLALNQPRALMLSKVLLEEPIALDEALERAPWAR